MSSLPAVHGTLVVRGGDRYRVVPSEVHEDWRVGAVAPDTMRVTFVQVTAPPVAAARFAMVATNVTCAVAEALRCATSQVTVADRVGRVTVYVEAPHSTAADLDAAERAASAMVPMGVVVRVRRSQMPAARAFAVALEAVTGYQDVRTLIDAAMRYLPATLCRDAAFAALSTLAENSRGAGDCRRTATNVAAMVAVLALYQRERGEQRHPPASRLKAAREAALTAAKSGTAFCMLERYERARGGR